LGVLDVRVNEQRVRLGVNGLQQILAGVEMARLGPLDFAAEIHGQILVDDTVAGRKEGENVLDEVLLVIIELLPVLNVLGEIDFLSGPECGLLVLVHAPHIAILDG
jgi:hypothetical protein